jgi:hypothetical protein
VRLTTYVTTHERGEMSIFYPENLIGKEAEYSGKRV